MLWIVPWAGVVMMWWEERFETSKSTNAPRSALQHSYAPTLSLSAIPAPRFFLISLLLCSIGSVTIGFHFRPHYFITLLPAISLLTGVAVSRALHLLKRDTTIELFLTVPVLAGFGLGALVALIGNGQT